MPLGQWPHPAPINGKKIINNMKIKAEAVCDARGAGWRMAAGVGGCWQFLNGALSITLCTLNALWF